MDIELKNRSIMDVCNTPAEEIEQDDRQTSSSDAERLNDNQPTNENTRDIVKTTLQVKIVVLILVVLDTILTVVLIIAGVCVKTEDYKHRTEANICVPCMHVQSHPDDVQEECINKTSYCSDNATVIEGLVRNVSSSCC